MRRRTVSRSGSSSTTKTLARAVDVSAIGTQYHCNVERRKAPLEQWCSTRFLSAVLRERVTVGLQVGLIAAAATTGVLLGLGRAHGATFRPLNAVAHVA